MVIIRLHRRRGGVEWSVLNLRLAAEAVEQLPEAGEELGPLSPDLTVLLTQPELYREPINSGQLLDLFIRGPEAGQTYLLAELGEPRISKQGGVTDELVEDVPVTV